MHEPYTSRNNLNQTNNTGVLERKLRYELSYKDKDMDKNDLSDMRIDNDLLK